MARQSLGRGLSALMGDEKAQSVDPDPTAAMAPPGEIDIDLIEPNPSQPRMSFSDNELDELAASIKANGIVQPIVVRPHGTGFQIVAGERRWRAAQRAELRRVPVAIRDVPDDKLLEIALIENIQRQELNPIEEASAYRKLIETVGLTQEQISERVGKERTLIATNLRLLQLPHEVQKLLVDRKLSLSHGRALLLSEDPTVQRRIADEIIENGLSVRETERLIKRSKFAIQAPAAAVGQSERQPDPNVRAAETKLMRHLSTNVKIVPARRGLGGKIEIEYYGPEDMDRIYEALLSSK